MSLLAASLPGAAAASWSEVCEACTRCGAELALLEGPLCDGCVDGDEAAFGRDIYADFREASRSAPAAPLLASRPPSTGRDRLAVDLTTGKVVVFHHSEMRMKRAAAVTVRPPAPPRAHEEPHHEQHAEP